MTQQELKQLQHSARLCSARNQLSTQIQDLQKRCDKVKKTIYPDPRRIAKQTAQEYLEKKKPQKLSHLFIALGVAMVPYAVFGILSELLGGMFGFLALAATVAAFVYVYHRLDKRYQAELLAQYEQHYLSEYQRITAESQTRYDELNAQLAPLRQRYLELERTMKCSCCIPEQYWQVGALLCQMVETGQANSLENAILLYQQQLRDQQLAQQRQAEADAQRWAQLQTMMNRDLAGQLDQKRRDQFREAADWMILSELLESE